MKGDCRSSEATNLPDRFTQISESCSQMLLQVQDQIQVERFLTYAASIVSFSALFLCSFGQVCVLLLIIRSNVGMMNSKGCEIVCLLSFSSFYTVDAMCFCFLS